MKLGLISLGCDKNTVDSERILARLTAHGAELVQDPGEAEVIVVNTCGFIDAAKQESIDTILDAARLKEEGRCRALVAVGCLVERHREALARELPEVDLLLGLRDLDRLIPDLQRRGVLGSRQLHPGERLPLGSHGHVRYLKVSEGCDHGCAFCAIPLWRGRHRSFHSDQLVAEAKRLEAQGAVELNLVAQDLAHYGRDRRDGTDITSLLRRLLDETDVPWIRLLYIYSAGLREPLVRLMASEGRVMPYIDMPIQHASDAVLERMRRPERRDSLRRKVAWLRESVPGVTLRTTVLVGFPGETDADFRTLVDFLEEARFDRLGAFAFSPQEGTRALSLQASPVPESLARARLEELLEVQRAISAERSAAEIGAERAAIVDEGAGSTDPALGRLASQADDVDGVTWLEAAEPLSPGQIVKAIVTGAEDFDLRARVVGVLRPAPAIGAVPFEGSAAAVHGNGSSRTRRGARPLPMAPLGLETAWGR
jgi:ribosomal protein S12 methylthiotransferase